MSADGNEVPSGNDVNMNADSNTVIRCCAEVMSI